MADDKISMIFDFLVGKNEVEKTLANTKKEAEKTQKSFFNLNNAIKFSAITAGFFAVKNILTKLTDAAVIQEKAIKNLNIAMALTGQYSDTASKEMQIFAKSLQDASMFTDEVILGQIAIAKAFGQTNDQAKQTVKAAIDLSSAMGISLDSAVKNLSKSFSGQLGELGELIPETKNLSKEALRSGEAVSLVGKKFNDFAKNQMGDFEGATNRAGKSFSELIQAFGMMITQNETVIGFFNGLADALNALVPVAKDLGGTFSEVGANIGDWADYAREKAFAFLDEFNPDVAIAEIKLKQLGITVEDFVTLTPEVNKFGEALTKISNNAETPAEKLKTKIKEIGAALRESFNKEDLDSIAGPNSSFVQNLVKSGASIEEVKTKIKEAIDGQKELDKNLAESAKAREEEKKKTLQDRLSFAGSAISGVGAGAAGAGQVIGAGAGLAAETFLGEGAGKIVGPLVQLLGMQSDQMRQAIRGFIDGAAEFILNIVENIPVLITELINGLPRFIDAVLKGLPRVITGIIKEIPNLINAFVMQIPNIIQAFIDNIPLIVQTFISQLVAGTPSIINGLIAEFPRMIPELMKGIGEGIINAIKDAFKSLLGGGGGGGLIGGIVGGASDLIGGIGDTFGFSHGGVVSGSGNRDSVPAMLTPGERVLTVEQNNIFEAMLSEMKKNGVSSKSGQPIQINLQIGTRELASVLVDINRNNLRVA